MEANNMKEMREALEAARSFVVNLEIEPFSHLDEVASDILARIDAALAKPLHEAKWTANGGYEFACCSNCGHLQYAGWDSRAEQADKIGDFHELYKFCTNCGAQMKGETDGGK